MSRNAATDDDNQALAETWARLAAVFSLYSDMSAQNEAQLRSLQRNAGPEATETTQKVEESLDRTMEEVFKEKKVHGLDPLVQKVVTHPITGQKMHVCVCGVSSKTCEAALQTEWTNQIAKLAVKRAQEVRLRDKIHVQPKPPSKPATKPPAKQPQVPGKQTVVPGPADKEAPDQNGTDALSNGTMKSDLALGPARQRAKPGATWCSIGGPEVFHAAVEASFIVLVAFLGADFGPLPGRAGGCPHGLSATLC